MKTKLLLLFTIFSFCLLNAQIINIPDANFKARLLLASPTNNIASTQTPDSDGYVSTYHQIDTNNDGEIQVSEALLIKYLNVYMGLTQGPITNLLGINSFINLQSLRCNNHQIAALDISSLTSLTHLYCSNNYISNLNVSTAPNLKYLECYANNMSTLNVTGLNNMQSLDCSSNQIGNLNLANFTSLQMLSADNNNLTSLNLSNLPNLTDVNVLDNMITTLITNNLPALLFLECSANQLTSLDVSTVPSLISISAQSNQITTINFGTTHAITSLFLASNQLTSLNLDGFPQLDRLDCRNNNLTTLDVSTAIDMSYLRCDDNQLTSLFIKRGAGVWPSGPGFDYNFGFAENDNLVYICANDADIPLIQNILGSQIYTCSVNSYCNFGYGGVGYTIQGNNKFDNNTNGCDIDDSVYPNLKFAITNSILFSHFISNASGAFSMPVQEGTHTITPQLDNPTYFSVSPPNAVVNFPTDDSPVIANFCIVPNGVHNDLEVICLPTNLAVPGFDAQYKIIYKNNGTEAQSGNITLTFDDSVTDFLNANPVVSSQNSNILNWNFTNLVPFESKEIVLYFNLNSPMETPPLNSGNTLDYTAVITGLTDEKPFDNTSAVKQTVVNSFDPNDKSCVEGNTVGIERVGEYVHYIIRFENNGTANAQNIVVSDLIDTTKFDLSSLVPISGSHSFFTRITSTNKVEFIFQNINLPFDNATNDGYVAFKIKIKSTLVLGDTFSNSANIYFDYNFPIVTNDYTTTIQALGANENLVNGKIQFYPNPVKDIINFDIREDVIKIEVYDLAGRILSSISVHSNKLNLSDLQTGNYIMKVFTERGSTITRILKE